MENLDIGRIAIGVVLVETFNLAIILLTKTETILKIVERIKGAVGLDYRKRAKRSDDEIRISKKHAQVARERVRHSFINTILWECSWSWNWTEDLEPVNIRGSCIGDTLISPTVLGTSESFFCNHPVNIDIAYRRDKSNLLFIACSQEGVPPHRQIRAEFEVEADISDEPEAIFNPIISKAIISERDARIAEEIKKLRLQFWR